MKRKISVNKQNYNQERRYRLLFEHFPNGFAYCKMLFNDCKPIDFIYLEVNKAFGEITGLMNVTGKRETEIIPGICDSNPEILEIFGRVVLSGQAEHFETYLENLKVWLKISVSCPDKEHFVTMVENITEQKLTVEELKMNEARLIQSQAVTKSANRVCVA